MITLIVRDENAKTYAGHVGKRFSTTLMTNLYSKDINLASNTLKKIISQYELEKFDNSHIDNIINLDSYGIYFIDLPNKIILTTNDYGDIKSLNLMEMSSMLMPNFITSNKAEFFNSIKEMLNADYFLTTKEEKEILLNCIDEFFKDKSSISSKIKLDSLLEQKFELDLNEEKIGWTIIQENKSELSFYEKLFNYFFELDILINEVERKDIISDLKDEILDYVEYPDETEIEIENLFFKIETTKEKQQLENLIEMKSKDNQKLKL